MKSNTHDMDRKRFLQKACLAGACFCGFGNVSVLAGNESGAPQDNQKKLYEDWLSKLLSNLNQNLDEEHLREIIKKSSVVHYNNMNMDAMLSDFHGDLDKFIRYIEGAWGWEIHYDESAKVLLVDENKDYCVCPILAHKKDVDTSAICYCSEGFAEKMFSVVTGLPVKARVVSSVRKGDKSCKYRIEIP